MDTNLLREFGFPVAMAITFCGALIWTLRLFISHFMKSLNEANIERKEITNKFTLVVENHISHNTEAMNSVCAQLKDMGRDHKEFSEQLEKIKV